jgi:hypothetical protein
LSYLFIALIFQKKKNGIEIVSPNLYQWSLL